MEKISNNNLEFDKRLKDYIRQENALLARFSIKKALCIRFPKSKKLPFLGMLGIKLLRLSGGRVDTRFTNLKKK